MKILKYQSLELLIEKKSNCEKCSIVRQGTKVFIRLSKRCFNFSFCVILTSTLVVSHTNISC